MIRFFISSTFDDMIAERELLHRHIVPQLNEYAQQFGESVDICDLRGGIDTSSLQHDDALYKIIDICLDAIESSDAVVAFLGNRYGTVPDDADRLREQWPISKGQLEDYKISITQLELEYGLLSAEQCTGLCYFRCAEGSPSDTNDNYCEKLNDLKTRLSDLENGTYCQNYYAKWDSDKHLAGELDSLEEQLLKDLKEIIKKKAESKKADNWIEAEMNISRSICEHNANQSAGRTELRTTVIDDLLHKDISVFSIYGPSGYGKSTLMANLYQEIGKINEAYFISCGHGTRSKIYLDILMQVLYALSGRVPNVATVDAAQRNLSQIIRQRDEADSPKLYIFIDGIDNVSLIPPEKDFNVIFSSVVSKTVRFIFSDIKGSFNHCLSARSYAVHPLEQNDILEIVRCKMKLNGELSDKLSSVIAEKRDSKSPLYVMQVIRILDMSLIKVRGKNNNEMYNHFIDIVQDLPDDLEELCCRYFHIAGANYLNVPEYSQYLKCIAAAPHGITKQDIVAMYPNLNELDFYYYFLYLKSSFHWFHDGRITFSHAIVAQAVLHKYSEEIRAVQNKELYPYLKKQMMPDGIHISDGLYFAARTHDHDYIEMLIDNVLKQRGDEEDIEYSNTQMIIDLMNSMRDICTKQECDGWFSEFSQQNHVKTMLLLLRGIEYIEGESYARIIPSMYLSDQYFDAVLQLGGVRRLQMIQRGLQRIVKSMNVDTAFNFYRFVAEYISAYELTAQVYHSFPYEAFACDFFCNYLDFSLLDEEKQLVVFKEINYIFYSNNQVTKLLVDKKIKDEECYTNREHELEQAKWLSALCLEWYNNNIRGRNYKKLSKLEGKFINNTAQYYNSVREYEKCAPYRAMALRIKLNDFQASLCTECEMMDNFIASINEETVLDSEFHERFWREYNDEFIRFTDELSDKERCKKIIVNWNGIIVSYNSIGTDCYYLPDNVDNADLKIEYLKNGIEFYRLCLFMQENEFCQRMANEEMNKERVVTKIRMLGIKIKLLSMFHEISSEAAEEITSLGENTLAEFVQFNRYNAKEWKNLNDNLVLASHLPFPTKAREIIYQTIDRLSVFKLP